MKAQFKNFVGIDISKATLDVAMIVDGQVVFCEMIKNTATAIKRSVTQLQKSYNIDFNNTVFCMEYTGIYGSRLIKYLNSEKAVLWLESGTHIKKSLGLTRGKSDKLDSKRIADFAFTHVHKIKKYTPAREVIDQLKILTGERRRYLKCKTQVSCAIKEQRQFLDKKLLKESSKRSDSLIEEFDLQIKTIEKQILQIIKEDEELKRLYKILTSVDGIGFVSALELLISTEEFMKINDPKKYACYSGVVPFEHSSGTSVHGKSRVSHMANKRAKTALHMSALSAIKMTGDLRVYYLRKVEEGKNKMSVINAVRNKIIHRVFACVRENKLFEKNYQYCLVNP